MPSETAKHHQEHVLNLTEEALKEAKLKPEEIDCICFTKGKRANINCNQFKTLN